MRSSGGKRSPSSTRRNYNLCPTRSTTPPRSTRLRLRGSMTVPRPSLLESDEPYPWTGSGGKFGLTSDWREAAMMPGARGGEATMRGGDCMGDAKQRQVREILERRAKTPGTSKVWTCYRSHARPEDVVQAIRATPQSPASNVCLGFSPTEIVYSCLACTQGEKGWMQGDRTISRTMMFQGCCSSLSRALPL